MGTCLPVGYPPAKFISQLLPKKTNIAKRSSNSKKLSKPVSKINSKTFQTSYAAWLLATYMLVRCWPRCYTSKEDRYSFLVWSPLKFKWTTTSVTNKQTSLMRHLVPLATVNFSQYLNLYSEVYPRYVPYVYWEKDGDRFLDFQSTGGFHLHLLVFSFIYLPVL